MDHRHLRFYWTVASGGSRKALREAERDDVEEDHGRTLDLAEYPAPENAMVSFATDKNKPWPGPSWFIDSGGYSTLMGNSEYEEPIRAYLEFVREQEQRDGVDIDRFALRDWACEDEILREHGRDRITHQNWTIRDHVESLEIAEDLGIEAEPVSVLQGYDLREYLEHLDYYREHGLLTDHIGIGSVCRRNAEAEIRDTLVRLREEIPDRITIHAFGVKKSVLRYPEVVDAVDSVDSAAWENTAYYNAISNASTGDDRYTWDRVIDAYREYRGDIQDLLDSVDPSERYQVVSISDFGAAAATTEGPWPLAECLCGYLVDPNHLDHNEPTCRHCEQLVLDIWDRQMDPDSPMFDPGAG